MRTARGLIAFGAMASILLGACSGAASPTPAPSAAPTAVPTAVPTAAPTPEPTATPAPTVAWKACQVSDTGGIDDKSFNQNAWKGMQDAATKLGVQVKFLESKAASDYEKNINQFLAEKCDMIVTVGYLLGDATKAAATANPNVRFSIVDSAYDPPIANIEALLYSINEGAMLAGYLAAGMSKTGKLGTFGGINIGGPVTDFMDGFVAGANYYNKEKGTTVKVLGWDPVTKKGSFTGDFDSTDNAKKLTISMLQEGADVILPVGGPIGAGAYVAIQEAKSGAMGIGVDVDWTVTASQYTDVLLTSIIKKIDVSVEAAVEHAFKGVPAVPVYLSTLANGGVDIAPFHDFDSKVSAELKAGIEALRAKIISGEVKVADYFKP